MDVTPLIRKGQQIIQSYADGRFKISGETYDHAVIVLPDGTQKWDVSVSGVNDLTLDDFVPLTQCAKDIDVVLLGAGAQMAFLPADLRRDLKTAGLSSVDIMDTGAACRTYNVLMAEGRRVACILLPA